MSDIRLIIVVLAQLVVLGCAEMCCKENFCECGDYYQNVTSLVTNMQEAIFNGNYYVEDDVNQSICKETYMTLYPTQGLNTNKVVKHIVQMEDLIQQPVSIVECSVNDKLKKTLPNHFKFSCKPRNVYLKMLTYDEKFNNLNTDFFSTSIACSVLIEKRK